MGQLKTSRVGSTWMPGRFTRKSTPTLMHSRDLNNWSRWSTFCSCTLPLGSGLSAVHYNKSPSRSKISIHRLITLSSEAWLPLRRWSGGSHGSQSEQLVQMDIERVIDFDCCSTEKYCKLQFINDNQIYLSGSKLINIENIKILKI